MEDGNGNRKRPLDIDWGRLLSPIKKGRLEEEPPQLLVVTKTGTGMPPAEMDDGEQQQQQKDDIRMLTDKELSYNISRLKNHLINLGSKLPDGGEKLRANISRHEAEFESRQRQKERDPYVETTRQDDKSYNGASKGFGQGVPSIHHSKSSFAEHFSSKLDDPSRRFNAFENEIYALKPSNHPQTRTSGWFSPGERIQRGLSSRQAPFQSPSSLSANKQITSNCDQQSRFYASSQSEKDFFIPCTERKNTSQVQFCSERSHKNGETVVLVDEEDAEPGVMEAALQSDTVDEGLKEINLYYPSREDPQSVEISRADMECLAPQTFLSSTVMNFYIRYLQQVTSRREREICDCHFFNTYFYGKLKDAINNKKDKERAFFKLRRWYKGVNIFEKAYILLPIHENFHWSLVIICIPDMQEESGLIILHLDSLRLHNSRSIFNNIRSFLMEEWNIAKKEGGKKFPISDKISERLSRRISDHIIPVPQQRNDSDCGVFVLYFMQRFTEEAPARLKKTDLTKFGKQWFNPEEASNLRQTILNLLNREFQNASKNRCGAPSQ